MTKLQTRVSSEAVISKLQAAGVKPTRKRLDVARLLFGHHPAYLTAEAVHAEAKGKGIHVSLATVYTTLHGLARAGLVQQIMIDSARSYFDTDTERRQHFFDEDRKTLIDGLHSDRGIDHAPEPPAGLAISRVDVIVRVRQAT